jgi:CRISPR-associated protein Csx3
MTLALAAYTLSVSHNVLTITAHPHIQANPEIVQTLVQQLTTLAGELKGGELLKINGKHSVPMAYVLSHHLGHLYGAIALYDPHSNAYIVTISHHPHYPVGRLIHD